MGSVVFCSDLQWKICHLVCDISSNPRKSALICVPAVKNKTSVASMYCIPVKSIIFFCCYCKSLLHRLRKFLRDHEENAESAINSLYSEIFTFRWVSSPAWACLHQSRLLSPLPGQHVSEYDRSNPDQAETITTNSDQSWPISNYSDHSWPILTNPTNSELTWQADQC